MRVKLNEMVPDKRFVCGIREYVDEKTGEKREEYFFLLKLPSYGMDYCIQYDDFKWCQRTLAWRGNHGFDLISRPI